MTFTRSYGIRRDHLQTGKESGNREKRERDSSTHCLCRGLKTSLSIFCSESGDLFGDLSDLVLRLRLGFEKNGHFLGIGSVLHGIDVFSCT